MGELIMWFQKKKKDVIKSKIQTDHFDPKQAKFKNWVHCAKHIQATQGFKGFYAGLTPCLLRAAPVNAATFLAYLLYSSSILSSFITKKKKTLHWKDEGMIIRYETAKSFFANQHK